MILEVHERANLLPLLPKEGHYEDLKELRRAREMIGFSAEEIKGLNIRGEKNAQGQLVTAWGGEGINVNEWVKEIPMSEYITSVFRKALAKMEKDGKLTEQYVSLYEKFVVMYQ